MLRSVVGVYDGNRLKLKEKVEIRGSVDVLVTFLKEPNETLQRKTILQRLLKRKPVKISPLKVKDLIVEGRK
ncbi:MAG: hypothetical protein HY957_10465 [Nitrospirae bacterium]|nr:hypothetical protein [Nitrospirota bacterium]